MTTEFQSDTVAVRLRQRVRVGTPDVCWLWTGAVDESGYGRISVGGGKYRRTHVVAYVVWVGPRGGLDVLHRCDVRNCCNPAHLYLGSHSDNMRDRAARGRQTNAKLTKEVAADVVAWYEIGGWTQRELAAAFGVDYRTVNQVVHGKTWNWSQKKAG